MQFGMHPSFGGCRHVLRRHATGWPAWAAALVAALICCAGSDAWAQAASSEDGPARWAAQAMERLAEARRRFEASPTNPTTAWEFARATFDRAEFATNQSERAALASEGVAAARQALARDSNCAPAFYYLGMNLGQLARTKTLGALRLVAEMERAFKQARSLDARFDFAGPDRNLGLLYLQAPVIGSIGDRQKARQHLQRAVELAPEYPENHLNLAEACCRWRDWSGALRAFTALDEIWPAARQRFDGPAWEASWADWSARRKRLEQQLEAALGPHRSTPRR